MLVRADVKCYYCGHVAGEVQGEYATLARQRVFRPLTPRDQVAETPTGQLRCPRCNGPVFLEGTEPVRQRKPRVVLTAADFAQPFPGERPIRHRTRHLVPTEMAKPTTAPVSAA